MAGETWWRYTGTGQVEQVNWRMIIAIGVGFYIFWTGGSCNAWDTDDTVEKCHGRNCNISAGVDDGTGSSVGK